MESYRLWLDDTRISAHQDVDDWIVVENFTDFKKTIERRGLPYYISFDHDLGDEKVNGSGMACAKWLVEKKFLIPEYDVHSENPVGARNIVGLLEGWKQFSLQEKSSDILMRILRDLGERSGFRFDEVWKNCPRDTQKEMLDRWTRIIENGMKFEIERNIQPYEKLIRR